MLVFETGSETMEIAFQKQEVRPFSFAFPLSTGIFEAPKKSIVIQLRWPLVIGCSYFLLYAPEPSVSAALVHGFLLFYVLSNCALYFVEEEAFRSLYFQVPLVVLDTLFLTTAVTLGAKGGADLYLACSLTILLCCICRDFRGLLGVAVLAPLLYGYFLLRSGDISDPSVYLRIPFPFVIALFYGYFVQVEHLQRTVKDHGKEIEERKAIEATIQRQLERLGILHEIDLSILSMPDLRAVLTLLLERVESHLSCPVATAISLFNGETGELEPVVCHNLDVNAWKNDWEAAGGLAYAVASRKALWTVRNIRGSAIRGPELKTSEGLVSFLGLPLIVKGEVTGVLSIYTRQEREFTRDEVEFLGSIANQAAIAIHNAQLYEKTKNQAAALERANAVKDQFLGVMSHELRTPLSVILGYVGIVHDQLLGDINAEQRDALGKVLARADDLLTMITSILYTTAIEAKALKVEWTEVSLRLFMDELKAFYTLPRAKKVSLSWDYPPELPSIRTDALKLKLILRNLIGNALKYTPQGHIGVSVRFLAETEKVEFKVADTGVGIPGEMLPWIFDRFHQVNGSANGSAAGVGLGLYIVKNFTEALRGTIEVESEPGRGSTFTLTLPAEQALKKRVLLVDDDESMIEVLGQELKLLGYQVTAARGGKEAVVKAAANPPPDLIVMDILMPGMDGLQATAEIRKNPISRSVPILAATAEALPGAREKCLAAGCDDYIAKPFTHRQLGAAIEELFRKTNHKSPQEKLLSQGFDVRALRPS